MTLDDLLIYADLLEDNDINPNLYKLYLNLLRIKLIKNMFNHYDPIWYKGIVWSDKIESFASVFYGDSGNGTSYNSDGESYFFCPNYNGINLVAMIRW